MLGATATTGMLVLEVSIYVIRKRTKKERKCFKVIWSAKPGDDSSSSCIVQPNSVDNSGENLVKTRQSEADFGSKISKYLFFFFLMG